MLEPRIPTDLGESESSRRRRRRRQTRAAMAAAKQMAAGRLMDMLMIGPLLLFMVLGAWELKQAREFYASMLIGSSRSDLIYGFGKPTAHSFTEDGERWSYSGDGHLLSADIKGDRVDRITCAVDGVNGLCPPLLGISSKAGEDQVWTTLGAPNRQWYQGDNKYLAYDDIGLIFGLTRFSVFSISTAKHSNSFPGHVARYFRLLLP